MVMKFSHLTAHLIDFLGRGVSLLVSIPEIVCIFHTHCETCDPYTCVMCIENMLDQFVDVHAKQTHGGQQIKVQDISVKWSLAITRVTKHLFAKLCTEASKSMVHTSKLDQQFFIGFSPIQTAGCHFV